MTTYKSSGLTGDWTSPSVWSPAGAPGANDTAAILAPGGYSIVIGRSDVVAVSTLTVGGYGDKLTVDGRLSAHLLAFTTSRLTLNGTISDTTIRSPNSYFFNVGPYGGTLSNVTYQGVLAAPEYSTLNIKNGLRVTSLPDAEGKTGPGLIRITSRYGLNFLDSETLDNVTISFQGGGLSTQGATLELGAGVTIDAAQGATLVGTGTIINLGRIVADVGGSASGVFAPQFRNLGAIEVTAGSRFGFGRGALVMNDGLISVSCGGDVDLSATDLAGHGRVAVSSRSSVHLAGVTKDQDIFLQGTLITVGVTVVDRHDYPNVVFHEFDGRIHGFVSSDRLDLRSLPTTDASVVATGGKVAVTGYGRPILLDFVKPTPGQAYGLVYDGGDGSFLITGEVIDGAAGGHASITNGRSNAIINAHGSENTINLQIGDGVINAGSGGATVTVGPGNAMVNLAGVGNHVTTRFGSNAIAGKTSFSTIELGHGNSLVRLAGSHNAVHVAAGLATRDTISLSGDMNSLRGSVYDAIKIVGNGNTIEGGFSTGVITGSHNRVDGGFGQLTATGDGNSINLQSGTAQIVGNGNSVTLQSPVATVSLSGQSNAVFLGSQAFGSVYDQGAGLRVVVLSGFTPEIIYGVGRDPSFVLDLVGGVGGYAMAAQAYAALQSDGTSSFLPLGTPAAPSSIELFGITPDRLSVGNFAVTSSYHPV